MAIPSRSSKFLGEADGYFRADPLAISKRGSEIGRGVI